MRIAALADLHGHFPEVPECDVVVIAGDIVLHDNENPRRIVSQYIDFRDWLSELYHGRSILPIGIGGNHDFAFQEIPEMPRKLPWIYLQDEAYTFRGVTFYGSPWQPWMAGWAFNSPEDDIIDDTEPWLEEKFRQIPNATDVLIAHSPPAGFGDVVKGMHRGSFALSRHIERVEPKLFVCGHIHKPEVEQIEGVTLCNASYVGFDRRPNGHPIQVFEIN